MKKILLFCAFILLLNTKSHAQTQFPFTGFELSNYEIGDTLEYQHLIDGMGQNDYCYRNEFYRFLNKEVLGAGDSIRFTLQYIFHGTSQYCGPSWSGMDTIQRIISNDTVYNNDNNLFHVLLFKLYFDSTVTLLDSPYVMFDTLNGLKKLQSHYYSWSYYNQYEVIQNIGLINTNESWEIGGANNYILLYAHLAHNGIYGTYIPVIYNNIEELKNNNLISIYPNPANENFFIQKSQRSNSASVQVFNYTGQLVFENKNFKEEKIDTQNLQNGFYVLKYSDGTNYSVKNFLVQH